MVPDPPPRKPGYSLNEPALEDEPRSRLSSIRPDTMTRDLEFTCGGGTAGRFDEPTFPRAPGRYKYEPYRSGSHYLLGMQLTTKGRAECEYVDEGRTVRFAVIGCPEYGVLELSDFSD